MPVGFSNSPLLRRAGQHVGIAGCRAPVLSVSLEHTVIDATEAMSISDGTPVHLLSRDAAVGPTLDELAGAQDRAGVEVLVALTGKARYAYVS
jgi:alanine racemase